MVTEKRTRYEWLFNGYQRKKEWFFIWSFMKHIRNLFIYVFF